MANILYYSYTQHHGSLNKPRQTERVLTVDTQISPTNYFVYSMARQKQNVENRICMSLVGVLLVASCQLPVLVYAIIALVLS